MNNKHTNIIIAIVLIAMAALSRILNHEMQWYNLAPIAALGLFCGSVVKNKSYAFLFAILAQFIGDLYIQLFTSWAGFYGVEQLFVYGALLMVTLLGTGLKQPKVFKVLGFSIAASLVFFVISNFGIWIAIEFGKVDLYGYGKGFTGLVATYTAAIPFLQKSLPADLIGSIILFGGYFLLQQAFSAKLQKVKA